MLGGCFLPFLRYNENMSRKLYLIAGPNGSGRTTLAKELIKEEKVTFLNADEIAEKLGDNIGLSAGRILLDKLEMSWSRGGVVIYLK